MKDVERIALILIIIGTIAFVFGFLQVTLLEIVAKEMTLNFKNMWFNALLYQDMIFFYAENISGVASNVNSHSNKFYH